MPPITPHHLGSLRFPNTFSRSFPSLFIDSGGAHFLILLMFPQQPLPSENFTLLMKYIQFFRCYKYLTFRNFLNMPLKEGETTPPSHPATQPPNHPTHHNCGR